MREIRFNEDKNKWLIENRGISFEEITDILETEELIIKIIENPSSRYKNQNMYLILLNDHIYVVPYIETNDYIFLKTAFISSKYTKLYLK